MFYSVPYTPDPSVLESVYARYHSHPPFQLNAKRRCLQQSLGRANARQEQDRYLQDESLILEMGRGRKHNQVAELLTEMDRVQNMFNWVREMAQNIIGEIGETNQGV